MKGKAYTGVTKVTWGWLGPDLYLKNSHAKTVASGYGILAIVAPLIPTPGNAVVTAILGGIGWAITNAHSKARGVIASFNFIGVPTLIWTRSQEWKIRNILRFL